MQKSRWIVLSLLALACSYHAEVSCMDALVIEMDENKTEVFDEESRLVSREHTSIQDSEGEVLYRDRCKKCSRCLDEAKYRCKQCASCENFSQRCSNCSENCKNCWNSPGCKKCYYGSLWTGGTLLGAAVAVGTGWFLMQVCGCFEFPWYCPESCPQKIPSICDCLCPR